MSGTPLQYDCWETVIHYLDANVRFQLSRRAPLIQKTDQSVPLRINLLHFDTAKTAINQTTYQLGIYKQYHYGVAVPIDDRQNNENGGTPYDVGEYDLRTSCDISPIEAGDLELRTPPSRTSADFMNALEQAVYRDRSKPSPFDRYIQLTVKSPMGTYIERFNYSRKLHYCMRYLNSLLLGGRQKLMQVRQVTHTECVVRLPLKFMIRIRELDMGRFDSIRFGEAIDESSYPLDVFIARTAAHLDHPACKTAKKLVANGKNEWFPRIHESRNQIVVVNQKTVQFNPDELVRLAENWLKEERTIGACFAIRVDRNTQILEKAQGRFEVISKNESFATIPMNENLIIKIFYEKENHRKRRRAKWFLKIEVCEK